MNNFENDVFSFGNDVNNEFEQVNNFNYNSISGLGESDYENEDLFKIDDEPETNGVIEPVQVNNVPNISVEQDNSQVNDSIPYEYNFTYDNFDSGLVDNTETQKMNFDPMTGQPLNLNLNDLFWNNNLQSQGEVLENVNMSNLTETNDLVNNTESKVELNNSFENFNTVNTEEPEITTTNSVDPIEESFINAPIEETVVEEPEEFMDNIDEYIVQPETMSETIGDLADNEEPEITTTNLVDPVEENFIKTPVEETIIEEPVHEFIEPYPEEIEVSMSDTPIEDLKKLTNYEEDYIEQTDINELFAKVSVNVKDASDIFRKNTDMKAKIDTRFEELKKLQSEIEGIKQKQLEEINKYKEEVLDKLNEKKEEIEKRLNTLKEYQANLEKEKAEFEKYKKNEQANIDKVQREVQAAYDDRREELNNIEDTLRRQKDALDEERSQLSLDRIQYEADKNELANNLLKFNELVNSFTDGVNNVGRE